VYAWIFIPPFYGRSITSRSPPFFVAQRVSLQVFFFFFFLFRARRLPTAPHLSVTRWTRIFSFLNFARAEHPVFPRPRREALAPFRSLGAPFLFFFFPPLVFWMDPDKYCSRSLRDLPMVPIRRLPPHPSPFPRPFFEWGGVSFPAFFPVLGEAGQSSALLLVKGALLPFLRHYWLDICQSVPPGLIERGLFVLSTRIGTLAIVLLRRLRLGRGRTAGNMFSYRADVRS